MNINRNLIRRPAALVSALALTLGVVAPALVGSVASAGQVSTRFIKISDATPSATGVQYNVSFKPSTTANIGGIVVDICSDSPIIGNTTCAYPAAFSWGGATPTTTGAPTGFSTATGSWVTTNSLAGGAGAGRQVFMYTNATAQTPTGTGTAIAFTVTAVANPSATGSFYARILTFDTSANAVSQYTATGTTRAATYANMLDSGGIAMSTDNNIAVTATVQETLAFCTSGPVAAAAPTTCGSTTTPTVTLGTGTPPTIDSSSVYDNSAGTYRSWMVLSTNALSGASVTMKSNWSTCNGLSRDSGTTCGIIGQAGALVAGTAGFGLKVGTGSGGTGTIAAANSYSAGTFHMGATDFTSSPFGDQIATTSSAPCANVVSQLTFGATAATTTQAGSYSTNENLIATGTF
jgi:hypothetical protein